jgi:hypothetical protein
MGGLRKNTVVMQQHAKVKGLACGNGGPCPDGPAFIRKAGLTSNAEVAWSKGFDVEDAADKAPTTMLSQKVLIIRKPQNCVIVMLAQCRVL